MLSVAKNLRKLRKEKNLTQDNLAEQLSVTRQAVSNWEQGKTRPDIETLDQIAEALNVDILEIIYGKKRDHVISKNHKKEGFVSVFVVFLIEMILIVIAVLLQGYIKEQRMHYFNGIPMLIYMLFYQPLLYAVGGSLLCKIAGIYWDIRVANQLVRRSFLIGGILITLLYSIFIAAYWYAPDIEVMFKVSYFLFSLAFRCPVLFVIPGICFYLGINKKQS